jgi:hypothetical protein
MGFGRPGLVLLVGLLFVVFPSDSHPLLSPPSKALQAGERLTYALTWMNIRGGTAIMEVEHTSPVDGHPALRLLTTATSSPFISKIYPVRNRVESIIDAETIRPHRMLFQRREGRRRNDYDVTFRHRDGTVLDIKDGVAETVQIPPDTHDLLSCLYYVRSLPAVDPGSTIPLILHHDKKNYRVEVRVEGVERVKAPWGWVDAVRALVVIPFQGIFLNEGNIQVWFTDDALRIPIMMKAKVIIGSVTARLIERQQS